MLDLRLKRKSGIPIYIQIKEQIIEQIRTGRWSAGQQLPTERQLAQQLAISRNTVSMAYRELEAEGVLQSHQGRGTFVAASDRAFRREGRKERLLRVIDLAIEEASDLGFSMDEFGEITAARVREKKNFLSQVKVAFIECNREQLEFYSKQLHLGSRVAVVPLLLEDFTIDPNRCNRLLEGVDLVVTTFFHVEQVYQLLQEGKQVVAIALEPELGTIVRIARSYPAKPTVLVCLTDSFARIVRLHLGQSGIDALRLPHTTTRDARELAEILAPMEVVLVSPGRKREVEEVARPGTEIIEFILKPDEGSISRLKSAILHLKKGS